MTGPDADATSTEQVLRDASAGGRAIRGGVLRVAGYGAGMALTAAASVALLRYLGVADFGRFATVTALVAIVGGVTDAGLGVVGQREYVLRATVSEQRRLLADLIGIRLVLTPLGVLIAALFALAVGYDDEMIAGTLLAGAGIVLANTAVSLGVPLTANLRLGWVTSAEIVRQAAIVAGILALVVAGAALTPFFAVQIAGGAAALVVTLVALRRPERVGPSFAWRRWRPLLTAAAPMAVSLVLNVIYLRLLLLMLSVIGTERDTGLFATSFRVLEVFLGIPILMIGAAFPILVRAGADDEGRLAYAMQRLTEAALLASTVLVLALAIAAEPLVVLLGGEEYREAAPVLRVQSFVLLPAFLAQVATFGLISIHRQRALVIISGVALVTVVALGGVLIPAAGDMGAAVAAVVGETALAVTAFALLRRARPALLPDPRHLWRIALAAVLAGAVAFVPGLPDAGAAAAAVVVFGGLVWRLGAVPSELLDALPRRGA